MHMAHQLKYGPPKAVDREFIYKMFARNPRDPKINVFCFCVFFLPGRCLDGFVPHLSSEHKISILDPKSLGFRPGFRV